MEDAIGFLLEAEFLTQRKGEPGVYEITPRGLELLCKQEEA